MSKERILMIGDTNVILSIQLLNSNTYSYKCVLKNKDGSTFWEFKGIYFCFDDLESPFYLSEDNKIIMLITQENRYVMVNIPQKKGFVFRSRYLQEGQWYDKLYIKLIENSRTKKFAKKSAPAIYLETNVPWISLEELENEYR